MVADKHPRLVPVSLLDGASCPWPKVERDLRARLPLDRSAPARLTPAEQCVLELVRAGCSNKEIASALGKAEPTVKHQVSSILQKTGAVSRSRLIAALLGG